MTATELRARARAARALYRLPDIERRADEAAARLDAALLMADADTLAVPGYRVTRTADGITVTPQAPTHADQLALWSLAQ